jgi:hypothetical protein
MVVVGLLKVGAWLQRFFLPLLILAAAPARR